MYINLHEVFRFTLNIKGMTKFYNLAQNKYDEVQSPFILASLEKANPLGKPTEMLKKKLDI